MHNANYFWSVRNRKVFSSVEILLYACYSVYIYYIDILQNISILISELLAHKNTRINSIQNIEMQIMIGIATHSQNCNHSEWYPLKQNFRIYWPVLTHYLHQLGAHKNTVTDIYRNGDVCVGGVRVPVLQV
jgi:hypothetical protein